MNETLLEMYYFRSFVDSFKSVYGEDVLKLYKPIPQDECWVGFDQVWTRTSLTEREFLENIRGYNQDDDQIDERIFLSFFLQYKVVKKFERRDGRIIRPQNFIFPFYRVKIDLTPNQRTGLSQHETLIKLTSIDNSNTYYVCPMVFPPLNIYQDPDLNLLNFVEVKPHNNFPNNTSHFILFQNTQDQPTWFSDSYTGSGYSNPDFIKKVVKQQSPKELELFLNSCKNTLLDNYPIRLVRKMKWDKIETKENVKICSILPNSLLILELKKSSVTEKMKERVNFNLEIDPFGEEEWR